jgi:hypothetical protein
MPAICTSISSKRAWAASCRALRSDWNKPVESACSLNFYLGVSGIDCLSHRSSSLGYLLMTTHHIIYNRVVTRSIM